MTDTPATEPATAPSVRGRLARLRRPALLVGGATLALATLYLAVMTAMWGMHVSSLRGEVTTLSAGLSDRVEAAASAAALLETAEADLDAAVAEGVNLANNKAQGEDFSILYADAAAAMSFCATDMEDVVLVTVDRYAYVGWTVRRYENDVVAFCDEISAAITELDTELEGALR